jgi:hypothetical protein
MSMKADAKQIRAALNASGLSVPLQRYLAERASVSLSYRQREEAIGTDDPDSSEVTERLARAELARMGIRPASAQASPK